MNYIRTKDGIYEVIRLDEKGYLCKSSAIGSYVNPYTVIAQADTIKELCDEVVVEIKFGSTGYKAHLNKSIDELKSFVEYLKNCCEVTKDEILNVYGAIWTSKGLIYVAKMNDKGELELI